MGLIYATGRGNLYEVKRLVAEGADVSFKSEYGDTALMEAAHKGHDPVLSLLIDKDADINAVAPSGSPVLFFHFT